MHWPSFFSWKIETVLFFLAEKEKNGFKKGPMSTRKGQAAAVTLLRREQLRSASAPTGMSEVQWGGERRKLWGKIEKRACNFRQIPV